MKVFAAILSFFVVSSPVSFVRAETRERFPKGVFVSGVAVGGMKREEGKRAVREVLRKNAPIFRVFSPCGTHVFTYPEIDFSDDLDEVFLSAKRRGRYETNQVWYLKGEEEFFSRLTGEFGPRAKDAVVSFTADGFFYEAEQTGLVLDTDRLRRDIRAALSSPIRNGEFPSVYPKTIEELPRVAEKQLRDGTKKIAAFRTFFNASDEGRSENIRLAAKFLDGKTVCAGETVSFNRFVGERTAERGFCEAFVIQGGEFVRGIGGGVCQVSTTLYNAAVSSGMEITQRCAHSLPVSYVAPSCDAMVSSRCDFCFKNPFSYPVYLSVKTGDGWIEATFYGKKTEYEYRLCGVKTGEIAPPEPVIRYGTSDREIKAGRVGIISEGYLETYKHGTLLSRVLLSQDAYAATRGIVEKSEEREE